MGTTPGFLLPYVEPADTLASFPAADKAQMEAVEAALASPAWGDFRLTVNQTIPTATATTVNWSTITNTGGFVNNAGVITIPKAGTYLIATAVAYASSSTAVGNRYAYLYQVNTLIARTSSSPVASVLITVPIVRALAFTAGQTLRISAYHQQGANLDLDAANGQNYLTICRL